MSDLYIPHVGWLSYPPEDDVARFLREGWFEYDLQAFLFLYLREGDSFIDCGAHSGLYSVLAGKLIGPTGHIVSIEPNPENFAILQRNLDANAVTWATPIEAAIYSQSGERPFHPGTAGRSAYSSLTAEDPSAGKIQVKTLTLGEVSDQPGMNQAAVVKIDVEGAEMETLRGLPSVAGKPAFPLLIVEFTEVNLRTAGTGTENLFYALEERGYQVCRFDASVRKLVRIQFESPVWHANYFAATDPEAINKKLTQAPEQLQRIALEIIERGRVCERLHKLVDDWEGQSGPGVLLEKTLDQLDEAYRRTSEANWRTDEANRRASEAIRQMEEAQKRVGEASWRTDEANQRASEAMRQMEEAHKRIGEANWRVDEANHRASEAMRQMEEAQKRIGEANWRVDEANQPAQEALRQLDEVRKHLEEANSRADTASGLIEEANQLRFTLDQIGEERNSLKRQLISSGESRRLLLLRLQEIAGSRFVRLGRAMGILKSPWLEHPEAGAEVSDMDDSMDRALQHLARRQFHPKVLLDIGAGKGWWSILAATRFPEAQIFMIDPLEEHEPFLKLLPERDSHFHYLRTAVADQESDMTMNITLQEEGSSLLSWAGEDTSRQRRIAVTTIDRLLADGKLALPDLVKIDVQGFELRVLQGAQQIFQSAEVFILEVNLYEFMRGCPRVHEVVSFMAERGYYLFDLAGMLHRPYGNDLAQMDFVFVSSKGNLGNSNRWS